MSTMSNKASVEVGAVVSARASALKPTEAIQAKFGAASTTPDMRLSNLHVFGQFTIDNAPMLMLRHPDFPNTIFYANPDSVRVQGQPSATEPHHVPLPPSSVQVQMETQQQQQQQETALALPGVGISLAASGSVTSSAPTRNAPTGSLLAVSQAQPQAPAPQHATAAVPYAAAPTTEAAAVPTATATTAMAATTATTTGTAATATSAAATPASGAAVGKGVTPPLSCTAATSGVPLGGVTDETAAPEMDAVPEPSEGREPVDDNGPFTIHFDSVVRADLSDCTLPTPLPSVCTPALLNIHDLPLLTASRAFEHFLPTQWMQDVLLPLSNSHDPSLSLTLGELLRFIGMWLAIASHPERELHEFWAPQSRRRGEGGLMSVPSLAPLMSQERFRRIMASLTLASESEVRLDRLCGVRTMLEAFNANTRARFCPGAVSRVDEAHSLWTHPARPAWPHPPPNNRAAHPLGNRYHALGCAATNVVYALELHEEVPRPPTTPPPQHAERGYVGGLLLRLTQGLWGTHRMVTMGSELGTAQALGTLFDVSVHATCHVDRRGGSWPRHVPARSLLHAVEDKPVGSTAAVMGVARLHHNAFPIMAAALRGPERVSLAMSTWVSLAPSSNVRRCSRTRLDSGVPVQYPEAFESLLAARDAVAHNNVLRTVGMPLETALPFTSWDMGQFAFLLAVVEANAYLAFNHFKAPSAGRMSRARFRRELVRQLVHNHLLAQEPDNTVGSPAGAARASHRGAPRDNSRAAKRAKQAEGAGQTRRGRGGGRGTGGASRTTKRQPDVGAATSAHELRTAPLFSGKFLLGEWTTVSTKYNQHKCTGAGCTRKIRTYCSCDPTSFLCSRCFVLHYAQQTALSPGMAGKQPEENEEKGKGMSGQTQQDATQQQQQEEEGGGGGKEAQTHSGTQSDLAQEGQGKEQQQQQQQQQRQEAKRKKTKRNKEVRVKDEGEKEKEQREGGKDHQKGPSTDKSSAAAKDAPATPGSGTQQPSQTSERDQVTQAQQGSQS